MSSLIDQRILIPAPANVIWGVLADQQQLPHWRYDCASLSILTTRQFGVGMRRRCIPNRGKDRVEEITAWYEGLGYEYALVDSRQFKLYTGRLRLQAVSDGTIVQWTVNYAPAGLMTRLRLRFGKKKAIETEVTESLRSLRRLVEGMGYSDIGEGRKRNTLQPVQSVVKTSTQPIQVPKQEAKADTKPRKPEGLAEAANESEFAKQFMPPATDTSATVIPPVTLAEPSAADTEPKRANVFPPETENPEQPTQPSSLPELPPGMPESLKVTPPKGTPKVDLSRLRYADELEEDEETPRHQRSATSTHIIKPGLPPPTDQTDTGQISIWEAFSLKAPSLQDAEALDEIVKRETGEFEPIKIEEPLEPEDTMTFSPLYRSSVLRVRYTTRNKPPQRDIPKNGLRVRPKS